MNKIFVVYIVLVKVTFPCLDFKPFHEFLPCSILEGCNKSGHGITDIIIVEYYFNPMLQPEMF